MSSCYEIWYKYLLYFCAWLIVSACITMVVVKENSSVTLDKKEKVELPDFNIGNSTKIDSSNIDMIKDSLNN